MRKFVILQGIVTTSLLALIGIAMGIGSVQAEARSPVQGEGRCAAPCWSGIQPGETLIPQANRILISQGYTPENTGARMIYTPPDDTPGCIVSLQHQEAVVQQTRLSICPGLRLGDMLLALGQPDQIMTSFLTMDFAGGTVRAQLHMMDCGEHLSPFSPVQFILLTEHSTAAQETVALHWQGFALPWRYLRSRPNLVVLAC